MGTGLAQSAVQFQNLGRDILSPTEFGKLIQSVAAPRQGKVTPLLA